MARNGELHLAMNEVHSKKKIDLKLSDGMSQCRGSGPKFGIFGSNNLALPEKFYSRFLKNRLTDEPIGLCFKVGLFQVAVFLKFQYDLQL